MTRIVFITWGGKGKYGRLKRSLLMASALKRDADIHFLTLCEGKTTAFLIDAGFTYTFFDGKFPEANLYIFDVDSLPVPAPDKSLLVDPDNGEGIRMTPLRERGKFQVLYPRYRHFHLLEKEYRKKGKKVLVALSSTADYEEVTNAIYAVEREGLFPVFAPHFEFPRPLLSKLRARFRKLKIIGPVQDLARAFWEVDIALISGRLKPYEAASIGVPAVYWKKDKITWEFQAEGAGEFYKEGVLTELYHSKQKREEMGKAGKTLVDGLGLNRMLELVRSEL